jgi:signal transduction histidine kinase
MDRDDPGSRLDKTHFAPAGRTSVEQLIDQMRRCLDDPCIKVVLEAVNGFVLILNENRQIIGANQELLDALGRHDPECVVGLRPGEAFNCVHFTEGTDGCGTSEHCKTCGAVLAILAAQSGGHPAEDQCRLSMYRDGNLQAFDLRVRATPLEINGCALTAFVLHDISALKRREVLEQVFLHDFLNAIGGIAGWSELLRQGDERTAAREITALAESLKEEVITQRTLLDAERGELVVELQEFDVTELIAKLKLTFARHPIAQGKELSILALPSRTQIVSDQVLLMRVLVNMVKNAFEATQSGGVVQLWFEWRNDAPTFVVQNAGVMPQYVQARLFERSFSTRSQEGRGIGTYSMKLYGERYLGGTVSFTSDEEGGTRFFVSLPLQRPSEVVPRGHVPQVPQAVNAYSVLLVEDNEPLLRLGKFLLARLGYVPTAFRSGIEALEVFRAAPNSFDAVITDWIMPKMGGGEFVQRLLEVRSDIPILVCTGMGETAVRDSRIHGCIGKPFTFRELAESLRQAISNAASRKSVG